MPDFFQGTELWHQRLVDPDNRLPVDYGQRMRLLAELKALEASTNRVEIVRELLDNKEDQDGAEPVEPEDWCQGE